MKAHLLAWRADHTFVIRPGLLVSTQPTCEHSEEVLPSYVDNQENSNPETSIILRTLRVMDIRMYLRNATTCLILMVLAGCQSYHSLALPATSNLAASATSLPVQAKSLTLDKREIDGDLNKGATPDEIGLLVILVNPDLVAQRAKLGISGAQLLATQQLPNPSLNFDYASLLAGPGTASAVSASLSQDIRSIVLYSTHVAAARHRYYQVAANIVWQEWQTAQKARLLAVKISGGRSEIDLLEQQTTELSKLLTKVSRATSSGALDIAAEAPLLSAQASAQNKLATARLSYLDNWQALDALLALRPNVRFPILPMRTHHIPAHIGLLIASLPRRRPDLVALRLGYSAADEDVRAAILGQFPSFSLGLGGGSDTSQVISLGPQITFDLPIFNRNQGKIAAAVATRAELRAQYQARLDAADGMARSLLARAHEFSRELKTAQAALSSAQRLYKAAKAAYAENNLSERALVDYEGTALQRALTVVRFKEALTEDYLALQISLGVGLPQTTAPQKISATKS